MRDQAHITRSFVGRQVQVEDSEFLAVSEGRIRIRIGVVIFLVALLVAILRLGEMTLLSPASISGGGADNSAISRADITDRNGEVVATTLATYALYAKPKFVWQAEAEETAIELVGLFPDLRKDDVLRKLTGKHDQILLKRGLTPKERQMVFGLGATGLIFEVEPQRVYPQGHLAAHIVGFTDPDMNGLAGAEGALDDRLSENGAPDVALSIDLRLQNVLMEELEASRRHFKAKTNAGVILNVKTGEILALASLPNFNPNQASREAPQNKFNHASMSTYELGSVFKPITMAMALEKGVTDLEEKFPVQQPLQIRDRFIGDDHPSPEPMAMPKILSKSSNRGTALIAMRAGGDMQQEFLRELGLFDRVPIELAESARPQVQSEWQDITTATVSYGHGISVTPLALSVAVGALLNDGVYVTPTILKRDPANTPMTRRVIRSETSKTLRDLMRYTVTDGTGRNASVVGVSVMGKTGTADKPSRGGYDERRLVSSFVAAFPYEDPTYVVFITFDEPKAVKGTQGYATAGWNAAPTTGKVIERIVPILRLPIQRDEAALSPFSDERALQ